MPMHAALPLLAAALLITPAARAGTVIAEDDASQSVYDKSWSNLAGGSGFGGWIFRTRTHPEGGETHAGFFIASTDENPDLTGAVTAGKAFGLFANGVGFEAAAAFRPLQEALAPGDTFSFLFEHSDFARKFDADDPAMGSIGLTLRSGNEAGEPDHYNAGSRFEFTFLEGENNYQIFDGEPSHDSGVPWTEAGVSVVVTLTGPDTYDVSITKLDDGSTATLQGRKLGGAGAIESFCVFSRDGEKADAFFNAFKVERAGQ